MYVLLRFNLIKPGTRVKLATDYNCSVVRPNLTDSNTVIVCQQVISRTDNPFKHSLF